jgi:hypothetical protein
MKLLWADTIGHSHYISSGPTKNVKLLAIHFIILAD